LSIDTQADRTDPTARAFTPRTADRQAALDRHGAPQPEPPPRRDAFLDNAKFLTVALVVVGHVWNNLRDLPGVEAGYLWLYLFHMPALVLVTGYLSRSSTMLTPRRAQQIVGAVLVPYLVFQAAYGVLADRAGIDPAEPGLVSPAWLMWFLAALACWRLTAAVWQHMRAPVVAAVLLSLLGGATSAGELALTQVLGLLPFFVLGLCLRPHHVDWLRRRAVRAGATVVLAGAGIACYLAAPVSDRDMEWVYWRSSYAELGLGLLDGALLLLGLLAAGLVLAAAFLALVPRRRTWFTALGAHTMYAYLLHGFLVLAAIGTGVFDLPVFRSSAGAVLLTALAAVVAGVLMTQPVRRATRPLVQPDVRALWRGP
jgi:fucose 4-O-acetylase-like acetyltransferase